MSVWWLALTFAGLGVASAVMSSSGEDVVPFDSAIGAPIDWSPLPDTDPNRL